eukprot:EG_transcript_23848
MQALHTHQNAEANAMQGCHRHRLQIKHRPTRLDQILFFGRQGVRASLQDGEAWEEDLELARVLCHPLDLRPRLEAPAAFVRELLCALAALGCPTRGRAAPRKGVRERPGKGPNAIPSPAANETNPTQPKPMGFESFHSQPRCRKEGSHQISNMK